MSRPRLDVMYFETTSTFAAFLARPVVSLHDCFAEGDIARVVVVGLSRWTCAAFPERMIRTAQNLVIWRRAMADTNEAIADRASMCLAQRSPVQRLRDIIALRLRNDAACSRGFSDTRSGNLSACCFRLRGIRSEIEPGHLARVRTEPRISFAVPLATLFALLITDLCHIRIIPKGQCRC